ncbi:ABC transporter ATP-binding protein [Sandaracinus amylolyticus]|uniref:ABC transporter multidrug efflux pump protein n=1 Tax=Sandaracinus amylolyticus TaxID=927083 RepID=A0A0F6SGV7_9BACT|nr:ABC transporter ATP-binding protein [Sandaracinus amylolyticus]AKF09364.1 ABC transporter multidrug efflux pump protein [Sandaracinus amylolyticus]
MSGLGITIDARDLVRDFGTKKAPVHAVRGLSLEVRRGELFGLVGPDAGGKTTTMRMIAGLVRPTSGMVRVLGEDPWKGAQKVRDALGLMPQEHSLYGDLSIEENMQFFSKLFCLSRAQYRERRERLLSITRLGAFTARRADALSGGMYKKLALMCALLHQPEVLLMDEPTNGVDPVSRRELWELIYELVDQGMTVLVSTPYMDEASRCHRVALVHQGRVLSEGDPNVLVRDLECPTAEVVGGDREAVHTILASLPEVLASSPAGAQLRVVIAPGASDRVAGAVRVAGASLAPAQPAFEDVFLAKVALAERQAA